MQAYRELVLGNKALFKQLETVSMLAVMVLPKNPELGTAPTEGVYAAMGLFTALNDAIIHGRTKHEGEIFASTEPQVHVLRLALTVLFHCSAFVEVSSLAFSGQESRDRVVLILELLKAFCRARLLSLFPNEVVYSGGHYESHVPQQPQPEGENGAPVAAGAAAPPAQPPAEAAWQGRRTGRALKLPQNLQAVSDRLALRSRAIGGGQLKLTGEILHLLRPLVYLMLMRRWSGTWIPWTVSLAMDLFAMRCTALGDKVTDGLDDFTAQLLNPGTLFNVPGNKHDAAELRRRRMLLVFYLLRSPAYENTLKRIFPPSVKPAEVVEDAAATAVSMFSPSALRSMVGDQLDYYNRTHFYNSAS